MNKTKYVVIFLLLAAIVVAFLFTANSKNNVQEDKSEEISPQDRAIPVEVEKVQITRMPQNIRAIGNIAPLKSVIIYPEATGTLKKLSFEEGGLVKKGDLIAVIESEKRELSLEQIKNEIKSFQYEIENIERDLERFQNLYEEGVVAKKRLQDIETQYNAAQYKMKSMQARLSAAERMLQETSIFSPAAGLVTQKMVDVGELVTESSMTKGSPIIEIVDITKVKLTVSVGERQIGLVKEGQKVSISTDTHTIGNFGGTVNKIMPVMDITTRTTEVEILVDNPNLTLRPGMFARTTIHAGTREVLSVPLDAVLRMAGSGNYSCFRLLDNNTVERVYIEIGEIHEGAAEVITGLRHNDTVVVTSQGVLQTGREVSPEYSPRGSR